MGLTKAQLEALNVASFPNNNEGLITPEILRTYNSASIANTVNQDTYTTDSASFDSRIDSIVTGTGFVTTSSFNAYTSSNDSKVNSLINATASYANSASVATVNNAQQAQINSLIAFTGSNTNTSLNSYTASNDTKWSNLGAQSGSWITESETGSFATSAITASSLITASISGQTLTFTKGDSSTFGVTLPSGSGGSTDISALNAFTASQLTINAGYNTTTASLLIETANLETFSASTLTRLTNIETTTASLNSSVSQLNANTASQQSQIDSLISATGSYSTSSTDIISLNAFTASQLTINTGYNTFTQSANQRLTAIESVSGSWITESETSSFARVNVDNPWSVTQNFTNITAVSASFQYVQTIFETASVIFSSGSNQFGDAANDVQTLYGSVRVMNELTASGLKYPTADNGAKSFMQTDGAGNLSFQYVDAILEEVRYGENITIGDPLFVSGAVGNRPLVWKADASNTTKMPVIYIATSTAVASTNTTAITLGNITGVTTTGYPVGTTVYVAEGGGWSANRPSGSTSIVQPLGIVTKEGSGGSGRGLVLNPGPATLPNLQTGYLWVGNGSNQPIAIASSSLVTNVSGYTTTASFNAYTSSTNNRLTNIESTTSSLNSSISQLNSFSASQLTKDSTLATVTASLQGQLTNIGSQSASWDNTSLNAFSASQLTKDATLQTYTASVNTSLTNLNTFTASANQRLTSIESVSGSWITESETSSFARTNANNTFTGVNSFGQVSFTGSAPTILSSSFSGSLITNLTDIYTDIPAVQQIVTLSSASYAALVSGSLTDPNTLYIVSGSISGSGGGTTDITSLNSFTASQELLNTTFATTGSNTFTGQQTIQNKLVIEEGGNPLIYTELVQDTLTNKLQFNQVGASGIDFNTNVEMNELTASLQEGYVWVGNSAGITTLVATSSFIDAGTDITALNNFTASQLDINTGYNTFTQSADQRLDSIESVSGSWITESETGSFAKVNVANTFTANQTISQSQQLNFGSSGSVRSSADTGVIVFDSNGGYQHRNFNSGEMFFDQFGPGGLYFFSRAGGTIQLSGSATSIQEVDFIPFSASLDTRINSITGSSTDITALNAFTASQLDINSGYNTFTASQEIINTNVGLSSSIYEEKFATIGTQSGSWGTGGTLPAGLLSSSVTNFVDYSASVDTRINSIVTGTGFATTGSNTFLGTQIISGSETIVNYENTGIQTLKLLPFVSSSTFNGNRDTTIIARYATGINNDPVPTSPVNIVFGANPLLANQTTITATGIVSGSNNIIAGTRVNATNAADIQSNYSYITVFPSTRTPAYAPARISNSIINGPITAINNTTALSQSLSLGSVGFGYGFASNVNQSGVFGGITFNPNSGSTTLAQSINAGNLTVNSNKVNPDFITAGSALSIVNMLNAGNTTIIDVASGSYNAGFTSFTRNILGGVVTLTNTREATTNANFQNSIVVGSNLIVTGSDSQTGANGGGSAFFGRYGVNDGITNNTSNTVFAVGAGTSGNLKTPLWIGTDQSVNIIGSLKINGNQDITGSVTFNGNVTMRDRSGNFGNIILGNLALGTGLGNTNSVAIGNSSMQLASGSQQNVAIGINTLQITSGSNNVAIGSAAMQSNLTGNQNVALGVGALTNNTTGFQNTAIGNDAMFSNTTSNSNFALGASALASNTEGNANIAIGVQSGQFASGSSNTFIGHRAGRYVTGSANTIIGGYESTAGNVLNNNIILADGVGNVKAQNSGTAWSLEGEIKLNKGSNKPADIVNVNGSATISNSLVTTNSIILVTCQDRQNQGDEYAPVVGNKTTGAFDIFTNYGGNMQVAYLIINPTA